jgi:hypothetical protein
MLKDNSLIKILFYCLIGIFLIILISMFSMEWLPNSLKGYLANFMFISWGSFFALGLLLTIFTLKKQKKGKRKKFLLLTSIAALSFPVFVVLHNLVYALFIYLFGEDFWSRTGLQDEPIFFILAVIICPIIFIIGAIGVIYCFIKKL